MKIEVDLVKCQGYANCVVEAPDLFDIDETGKAVILVEEVPESAYDDARRAAADCPVAAIRTID